MTIRTSADLTRMRQDLVAQCLALAADLEAARTTKDLERVIWSLKGKRIDEAIADLVNAIDDGA